MSITSSRYRRILVIDDNTSIHTDFQKILQPGYEKQESNAIAEFLNEPAPSHRITDFEIEYATQGEEGHQRVIDSVAADRRYGTAFVDMRMPPGWDGLKTIERLWEADPELQIVLCTAYLDYSWSELSERIGDTDQLLVLKKPFDNIEVKQLATALCEKRALRELAIQRTAKLESIVAERTQVLKNLASTDSLTQLPNRPVFHATLDDCIAARRTTSEGCDAVLFLDLDNFKLINDSMGHQAGDALLIEVASRIQSCIRATDQIIHGEANLSARMGGDEFAILVRDLSQPSDIDAICKRLIAANSQPIRVGNRDLIVGASIGVAIIDSSTTSSEDVLRKADTAMYAAKQSGRNCSLTFNRQMHDDVVQRLDTESDIRSALADDRFEVHYQPIVSLSSLKTIGYEALVRMRSESGELVPPDYFIPTAEETGLIVPIGQLVLDDACRFIRRNQLKPGMEHISIGVNVSQRQLMRTDFVQTVRDTLTRHEINARGVLSLEITESMIMDDVKQHAAILEELRSLGIAIHLDDFGTGYSSLACLHQFSIDVLKIDRSFVSGDTRHETGIVGAIIGIANALNIRVIGEGIETPAQLEWLKLLGCDMGQGYLFGKPTLLEQPSPAIPSFTHSKRSIANA